MEDCIEITAWLRYARLFMIIKHGFANRKRRYLAWFRCLSGIPQGQAFWQERYHAYCKGHISFAEVEASVQDRINPMRFADSWGLRRHILKPIRIKPGDLHQKIRAPVIRYSRGDEHNTRNPRPEL